MYRYFLAIRYLLSRPINLLGVLGVTLGVWALILVVSIFSGFIREVRGHVQSATSDISVANLPLTSSFAAVRRAVMADPNVASCAPRIAWFGLLHPRADQAARAEGGDDVEATPFVHLIGIDPAAEAEVSGLSQWLANVEDERLRIAPGGPPLAAGDDEGIVLSERRAHAAGLAVGDGLRLTCARLDSSPRAQTVTDEHRDLRLAGAFATKHTAFDAMTALVHIDTLRDMLGVAGGDGCNVVAVRLRDTADGNATAERLERALWPLAGGHTVYVQTWEETNAIFLSAVDHQRSLMKLVLFVIMIVAAFLMYATLSMMVTEKTYDIGILTAMGATRAGVLQVFLSCGLAISVLGVVFGIVTGCLSSFYLDHFHRFLRDEFGIDLFPTAIYNLRQVPYDLDPWWIAQVSAMALAVGALVSGGPAWRAARHDPVEALRAE
jgi:lipoprotein-releasing system permease protein